MDVWVNFRDLESNILMVYQYNWILLTCEPLNIIYVLYLVFT